MVLSDDLNHASVIDGCSLSRAEIAVFHSRGAAALEAVLTARPGRRCIVVSESLFSTGRSGLHRGRGLDQRAGPRKDRVLPSARASARIAQRTDATRSVRVIAANAGASRRYYVEERWRAAITGRQHNDRGQGRPEARACKSCRRSRAAMVGQCLTRLPAAANADHRSMVDVALIAIETYLDTLDQRAVKNVAGCVSVRSCCSNRSLCDRVSCFPTGSSSHR